MKKVLILYGSYGGGHLSAAKSISEFNPTFTYTVKTIPPIIKVAIILKKIIKTEVI